MTLAGEEAEPRPDERKDDRPEDREDDTDRAIKLARAHCIEAVEYLVTVMRNRPVKDTTAIDVAAAETRARAAIALLEVAGCL